MGRKTSKGFYNVHIQQEEKQVKGSTMFTFHRKKNE
jgi:hypothetical protein